MAFDFFPMTAAAALGLVWYGILVHLDPARPGRWLRPLLPMAGGWAAFRGLGWYMGHVHSGLISRLPPVFQGHGLIAFITDIGLREEIAKLLGALFCVLPAKDPSRGRNPLLAGAATGLGFATVENVVLFREHALPSLLFGRLAGPVTLHLVLTGLMAAAVAAAGFSWRTFLCLVACVALHGLYDWGPVGPWTFLRVGGTSWLSQAIVALAVLAWARRLRRPATSPAGSLHLLWMTVGFCCSFAAALAAAWLRWGTSAAVLGTAVECARFLPLVLFIAVCLARVSHRANWASLRE